MSNIPGLKTVGLLGGGVIGGAWAARFVKKAQIRKKQAKKPMD